MKKIVLKSSLITVGALAVVGILIFSLWILIAPQSMATVSEKLGNYNFAVTCANLKYKYSDETADLARCAEDSILCGEDKLIIKYCEELIDREDFNELCRRRDEELSRTQVGKYTTATNYNTYIIGTLAAAQYRAGDLEKAVKTAERGKTLDYFRKLVIEVFVNGTAEDKERVQTLPEDPHIRESVSDFIKILEEK